MRNKITIGLLILVLLLVLYKDYKNLGELKVYQEKTLFLTKSLNDSIKYYKEKNGKIVSFLEVIEDYNEDLLLSVKTKDKEIEELKKLLNKKTKVATIIKTETKFDTIIKWEKKKDTIVHNINADKWIIGNIKTYDGVSKVNLLVNNQFDYMLEKRNDGHYLLIRNNNPYTHINSQKTYLKLPPIERKERFIIGPYIGVGYGNNGISSQVGIGLTYKVYGF